MEHALRSLLLKKKSVDIATSLHHGGLYDDTMPLSDVRGHSPVDHGALDSLLVDTELLLHSVHQEFSSILMILDCVLASTAELPDKPLTTVSSRS